MDFPPGDPVAEEDPRQLLHELWRFDDRSQNAPYGERYVGFEALLARVNNLDEPAWIKFQQLYQREHQRRRLPAGTELDWMERARARRAAR